MDAAPNGYPTRLQIIPMKWHPLPLTISTKKALMDSFSHYENFSYDEEKGGFLVEVPIPPGRGKVPRAAPTILKDHTEVDIQLTSGGNRATCQPRRPQEQCYSWWLGQLVHYGLQLELSADEAKQVVKNAILQGALKVPAHLKKMEQSMRSAAHRRTKKQALRLAAKRSASKRCRKHIKVESVTSGSDVDSDVVPAIASRSRQSQAKVKKNFSNSETDFDTIRAVTIKTATNNTKSIVKTKAASIKTQTKQIPGEAPSRRKAGNKILSDISSSGDDAGKLEDIPHHPIGIERHQYSSVVDSESDHPFINKSAVHKAHTASDDSDGDSSVGGSLSGDSEYERAVLSHAEAINGAGAKHENTDIDSSSKPSSDALVEVPSIRQLDHREAYNSTRYKSDVLTPNVSTPSSKFVAVHSVKPKQLQIKRDRKPLPEELEEASIRETTPSHTLKRRLKHNHQPVEPATTADQVTVLANAHPEMTYEDVHDPIMRRNIAKMRSIFPNETIHLCYTCLAKHWGNYDRGCEELVKVTTSLTPAKPAWGSTQDAHDIPSGMKRQRSSSAKQVIAPKSSPAKRHDLFQLSDSDELIVKREPSLKRRKASCSAKRVAIIPNDMHGSQIDLTVPDEAGISDEVDINPRTRKHDHTSASHKKAQAIDKPALTTLRTVTVEIPLSPIFKSHFTGNSKNQNAFPASPPIGVELKGILKSSPSFRPRDAMSSKSLITGIPPLGQSRTTSSDLPAYSQRKKPEPGLPPQPPPRKLQQKAALHNRVTWHSYTTGSGWQALNPNSKSKMRPSG